MTLTKLSPFQCGNCGAVLGFRDGDVLKADIFEIEFKKTQNLRCTNCGKNARFPVNSRKGFDRKAKTARI